MTALDVDPPETGTEKTGAQLLVAELLQQGVDTIFCVPGESYLWFLDALYEVQDRIRLVSCRHESAASFMANAYGKLTGRVGVCAVSRGPGITNASIGIHVAQQDSTPVVVIVGQIPRVMRGRDAFQEMDIAHAYRDIAKDAIDVATAAQLPEVTRRAFSQAQSGRPGPVLIVIPEDVFSEKADVPLIPPAERLHLRPAASDMDELQGLLAAAERPLILAGGPGWSNEAAGTLGAYSVRNELPAATAFRYQDAVDNEIQTYAGDVGIGINPRLAARIRQADLLLAIGTRFDDIVSGAYQSPDLPTARQTLVHVHPSPADLQRYYQPRLSILSDATEFVRALAMLPPLQPRWRQWADEARSDYLAWRTPASNGPRLDLAVVMRQLRETLPADAIVASGAGNYTTWVHRYFSFRQFRTQLAPIAGTMGYGVPAAVAAGIIRPERQVVCVAGDGCFMMSSQELATARQTPNVVFMVVNNGMYGTIRLHQERHFPGRVMGTSLTNPDFVAFAQAFGLYAETVTATDEFLPAFRRATSADRAALLELQTDPAQLTPTVRLDAKTAS